MSSISYFGKNELRAARAVAGLFVLIGLSSCASTPDLEGVESGAPTVKDIVHEVQCEVLRATTTKDNRAIFQGSQWAAVATLTLQVDDSAQLSPTLSFINPLSVAASFAFGIGAQATNSRTRIFNETITMYLDQNPAPEIPVCSQSTRLAGDLKIEDVVDVALRSTDGTVVGKPPKGLKGSNSFGETVQFAVVRNVNGVGPTWSFKTFKGPGGLIGASRTNTQKLVISFASAAAGSSAAAQALGAFVPRFATPNTNGFMSNNDIRNARSELPEEQRAMFDDVTHSEAVAAANAQNLNMLLQSLHTLQ
jgi:hypothetical protein